MKTYAVFPGLEALLQPAQTRRWLQVPEVVEALDAVSGHLSHYTGQPEDLVALLRDNPRFPANDMDRVYIAHTGIQTGIYKRAAARMEFDGLAGCSLGDLARFHVSGAADLRSIVGVVWLLVSNRALCPRGEFASVRALHQPEFSPEQLDWLGSQGLSLSLWAEHVATISGTVEQTRALRPEARARGMAIGRLYPFPFHSPLMVPVAEKVRVQCSDWQAQAPRIPVYSSIFLRHLETVEDMRAEAYAGTVSPVHWLDTLRNLRDDFGVRRLVNIGPTDTITKWLPDSLRLRDIEVIDAWTLCQPDQ